MTTGSELKTCALQLKQGVLFACGGPDCQRCTFLQVEGEIPEGLEGTFYRNGAGLFEIGGQRIKQATDGDGLVRALYLL